MSAGEAGRGSSMPVAIGAERKRYYYAALRNYLNASLRTLLCSFHCSFFLDFLFLFLFLFKQKSGQLHDFRSSLFSLFAFLVALLTGQRETEN